MAVTKYFSFLIDIEFQASLAQNITLEELSDIETEWINTNLTVLGKERWKMSFGHFSLIFTIFHFVYGVIACICDLFFFQAMVKDAVSVRYIATVLPVHRLFFLVITSIDGLVFMFTGNIISLIDDTFPVAGIIIISLMVLVDTLLVMMSYQASKGKPALVFTTPWRNLMMIVIITAMITYYLVTQYPKYYWDIIPMLAFCLSSIIILIKVMVDNNTYNNTNNEDSESNVANFLNFIMCISSSNILGLFSVGIVTHRLIFHYYSKIMDYL